MSKSAFKKLSSSEIPDDFLLKINELLSNKIPFVIDQQPIVDTIISIDFDNAKIKLTPKEIMELKKTLTDFGFGEV